jgi:hypothetical protein
MLQDWTGLLQHPPAPVDGANLTNTVTATAIEPNPGGLIIPKLGDQGSFDVGQYMTFDCRGRIAENAASQTIKLGLYYGGPAGVKLAESGAITLINSATVSWPWRAYFRLQVRAIGGAGVGSLFTTGELLLPASLTQYQAEYDIGTAAAAAVSVDMSTAKALSLVATWGAASASNIIACHQFLPVSWN